MNMARTHNAAEFKIIHEIKFTSVIHGYHIYKTVCNAIIGEVLYVKPDNLKEALEYHKYAMGILQTQGCQVLKNNTCEILRA